MSVRAAAVVAGSCAMFALSPLNTAIAAEVVPVSDSGTVSVDTLPEEDNCFHEAAHLSGSYTVMGHAIDGDVRHQLIHSTFDYTVRYADPALPVYSGHQVTNETILFNSMEQVVVYNFHQEDAATGTDGSRTTVRETLHFTFVRGVLKAEINRFNFTCPS